MSEVRARFAPSPTGLLHVGSARTALLNHLFVRAAGGQLLLRFDDTDAGRSDATLEAGILEDLRWLGIQWDAGPVRQSERSERYAAALEKLPVVRQGDAYEFAGRVIARSDGTPLYHLATAVDDLEDGITHVLRGRDHLPNTEFQIKLIEALGGEPPRYIHAPLLVFAGGAKVSKRDGDAGTIADLRGRGFPAAAVANALALSLADFGTDELMLSLDAVVARFDVARLHSADSQFDLDKLAWLSGQHIRAMDDQALAAALSEFGAPELPAAALTAARTGGDNLVACAETAELLVNPPPPDDDALAAMAETEVGLAYAVLDELIDEWPPTAEAAQRAFTELKGELRRDGYDVGVCLRGLRAVISGRTWGPEFPLLLACVSKSRWENAGY